MDDVTAKELESASDFMHVRPALPFVHFRFDRASSEVDADYADSLRQLVQRGHNFEPMATAVADSNGQGKRRLDVDLSEQLDLKKLMQEVRQAVAGESDSSAVNPPSDAVWRRVAFVSDVPSLLGAPVLEHEGGVLGFLRLRTIEPLTRPH